MTGPFGCLFGLLFAFLAFLLIMVLNIARRVRNIMFSFSPKNHKQQSSSGNPHGQTTSQNHSQSSSHGSHKIFDDNEGEYVDYEEIK